MTATLLIVLFGICLLPLAAAPFFRSAAGKRLGLFANIAAVALLAVIVLTTSVSANSPEATRVEPALVAASDAAVDTAENVREGGLTMGDGLGMLGIALVTGMSCIGAGIAVSASATAAIGAISENSKAFGKALIFVALAEGVALYGMLISIQMLAKI